MNQQLALITLLVAALFLGACGKSDNSTKSDKDALQGNWTAKSMTLGTMPAQNLPNNDMALRFEGDKAIGKTNGKDDPIDFKLDPSKNPKEIDLSGKNPLGKDETQHGIYELNGDTLRIAMPSGATAFRPTSFNDPNAATVEFTRQK